MRLKQPFSIWIFAVILSASFCATAAAEKPFPYTRYRTIVDPEGGVTWYCFGDQGGGAYLERDGEWTEFTENNSGLVDNRIEDILIDGDRTVWFLYVRNTGEYAVTSYDEEEWNSYYPLCMLNTAYIDDMKRIHLRVSMLPFSIMMDFDTYFDGTVWLASPQGWGTHPSGPLDTSNPLGAYEDGAVPEVDFFPLSVGSTWTYRRTLGGHEDFITLEIIGTGEFDGETYAVFGDGRAFRQDSEGNVYRYDLPRKYFDFTYTDGDSCKPYNMVPGAWDTGVTRRCFSQDISDKSYSGYVFSTNYGSFIGADSFFLSPGTGMVKFWQATDFTPMDNWELVESDIRNYPVFVRETADARPAPITLAPYPNPFNPETTIVFSIPAAGPAVLDVYNIAGQRVRRFDMPSLGPGEHHVVWNGCSHDGTRVSSGVYILRLWSGGAVAAAKVVRMQ